MKAVIIKILKYICCKIGIHNNYKWNPYPTTYKNCKIDKCKNCGYYNWR